MKQKKIPFTKDYVETFIKEPIRFMKRHPVATGIYFVACTAPYVWMHIKCKQIEGISTEYQSINNVDEQGGDGEFI